jgi:hypothetical protein
MITESAIYWVLKLDELRGICVVVCVISGLLSCGSLIGWIVNAMDKDDVKSAKSLFFKAISVFMLGLVIGALLPSTKQMAMIKVIPAITNSEFAADMSKDAKELYKMGIEAIKEQLTNKNNGKPSK